MSKPRSKKKVEKSELVSIGELAELSNTRYSTLKHYTEIKLLEFKQVDSGLKRYYPKVTSLNRLSKIKELKVKKRLTITEIVEYFNHS